MTRRNLFINIILVMLILFLLFYKDDIIKLNKETTKNPKPVNEDDLKVIKDDIKEDEIIGVSPNTLLDKYEKPISDLPTDFYTISDLIKPEYYFINEPNINLKNNYDNCKIYSDAEQKDVYYNCIDDNNIISLDLKDSSLIYQKEREINGKKFYIGNNLVSGFM